MAVKGDFTPNEYVDVDGVWCMSILHKGSIYHVKIDEDDIPLLSKYRWYLGRRRNNLYCIGRISSREDKQYLHRFLIGDVEQVDHINGDTLDNRRGNLRACNNALNSSNKMCQTNNELGYKNIIYEADRGKYRVQIESEGRKFNKRYKTLEEAINARNSKYEEWSIPCEREMDRNE